MDLGDPRQWNAYVYANNSPVSFSDPTGLYCDSCDFYNYQRTHYEKSPASVGCGYSPNGLCGPEGSGYSQREFEQRWQWETGTGDGSNQPIIYGHRLPTAEEMKRGPIFGAPVMMAPDESYAKAVANWATYLCRSSNPGAGFCEWSYTVGNRPADGWDLVFTVVGAVSLAAGAVGGSALRGAGAASKEAGWLGKAAKVLGSGCGDKPGNSFAGGTQVLMADGSTKRIDEIKLGDQVLATDPESGESGAHEVVATIIGEGIKFLEDIEVDGGKIAATDKHPFWLPDQKRWVNAEDLTVGSALQTSAGTRVQVTAIKERIVVQRVHNLTVDGIHTYYVMAGDTPVLVHNCDPIWTATRNKSSVENAYGHFVKHGGEFDDVQNSLQYVRKARGWFDNPTSTTLSRTRSNGDVVRFDPETDYFGVMTKDGTPRTFFRPDPAQHGYPTNLDYFNAQ
jgi:hypothetical protein